MSIIILPPSAALVLTIVRIGLDLSSACSICQAARGVAGGSRREMRGAGSAWRGPAASGARRLRGPSRFEARRLGAACRRGHAVLSPGVAHALPHESGALMDRG